MRKLSAVLFGLMMFFGISMFLSSPAAAQAEHYPDAGWQVRDITCDPYPDCTWVDPAIESEVVDETTVVLDKPLAVPDVGTSIETTNLNLTVDAETTMTVNMSPSTPDVFAAGAVRMFYYDSPDADTVTDAPTQTVLGQPGDTSLSITVPAGTTIGTMGLTYDASNPSVGAVTFSNLMVGDTDILFLEPATPVSPSPSPSDVPSPTPTVTESPSTSDELNCSDFDTQAQAQDVLVQDLNDPHGLDGDVDGIACEDHFSAGLPVTGSSLPWFLGSGVVLIGLGAAAYAVGRKRCIPAPE